MAALLTFLRIVHIFSGVIWLGIAFVNIVFLQPAIRASGPEGQQVMGYLTGRTRFLATSYTAATLTALSGLLLYGILSDFKLSYLASAYGLSITIGGLAGLIGWVIVMVSVRGILNRMRAIGAEIKAQGGPPQLEQAAELGRLGARLTRIGQASLVLMAISLLGMSGGQYLAGF